MLFVERDVIQTTFLPVFTVFVYILKIFIPCSPVDYGLDTQGTVFVDAEVIDMHLAIHCGQGKHRGGQG